LYYFTTESVQYVLEKLNSEFLQLVWLASVAIPVPGGLATALTCKATAFTRSNSYVYL